MTEPRITAVPTTVPTGTLTGRYNVERELGRGGMATVCLAQDLKHDRRVA
jgi:serine/threonine-protein kinase